MAERRIYERLEGIDAAQWNVCFAGVAEDYDYLMTVEQADIKGFAWRYVTLWEGKMLVAAMPMFISDYELDTTLQGVGKKITNGIRKALPRLLTLKLACLGSPCTEAGIIGIHPSADAAKKELLLSELLDAFEQYGSDQGCRLLGIKDIPETFLQDYPTLFSDRAYGALPGMPTAWLAIDFASLDEYLARLTSGTRKDMKRKLKSLDDVRIEYRSQIEDVLPRVMSLYHDTRNRSEWQFEELTDAYFQGLLERMTNRSFCTLYWVGDELMAANLMVHNADMLIDKFFCMDGEQGRKHNLYFLSWFTNIDYCLKHGISRYQSGQAYYENKLKLGSELTRNTLFFKHRNVIAQGLLKFAAPFLGADDAHKDAA